jgi:predicted transcriptional regulator
MSERERDDHGRYSAEHSDEEFVNAVREHEPAGTQEVADEIGIARQSADHRLRRLEEAGHVSKKKVGRSLVWSVDEGDE